MSEDTSGDTMMAGRFFEPISQSPGGGLANVFGADEPRGNP
jgi:hypothetical protein